MVAVVGLPAEGHVTIPGSPFEAQRVGSRIEDWISHGRMVSILDAMGLAHSSLCKGLCHACRRVNTLPTLPLRF
jgi:hypothetical protein